MTDNVSARVVHFPPLPPIPVPPVLPPDPRQQKFSGVMDGLTRSLGEATRVQVANTSTGFYASAPDLGRLQTELHVAVARFDIDAMKHRWNTDLRAWVVDFVFSWVQRGKELQFDWSESGVRLRLGTQDDAGYYDYAFDVSPGRR